MIISLIKMTLSFIFFTYILVKISLNDFGNLNYIIIILSFCATLFSFGSPTYLPVIANQINSSSNLVKYCYQSLFKVSILAIIFCIPIEKLIYNFYNIKIFYVSIIFYIIYFSIDQILIQFLRFSFDGNILFKTQLIIYSFDFCIKIMLFSVIDFSVNNYLIIISIPNILFVLYHIIFINKLNNYRFFIQLNILKLNFKNPKLSFFFNEVLSTGIPFVMSSFFISNIGKEQFGLYSIAYKFYEILGMLRVNLYSYWVKTALNSRDIIIKWIQLMKNFSFSFLLVLASGLIYFFFFFKSNFIQLSKYMVLMLFAHYLYIINYLFYIKAIKTRKYNILTISTILGFAVQLIYLLFININTPFLFILNLYIGILFKNLATYVYFKIYNEEDLSIH
jgi:hypothetical protein